MKKIGGDEIKKWVLPFAIGKFLLGFLAGRPIIWEKTLKKGKHSKSGFVSAIQQIFLFSLSKSRHGLLLALQYGNAPISLASLGPEISFWRQAEKPGFSTEEQRVCPLDPRVFRVSKCGCICRFG